MRQAGINRPAISRGTVRDVSIEEGQVLATCPFSLRWRVTLAEAESASRSKSTAQSAKEMRVGIEPRRHGGYDKIAGREGNRRCTQINASNLICVYLRTSAVPSSDFPWRSWHPWRIDFLPFRPVRTSPSPPCDSPGLPYTEPLVTGVPAGLVRLARLALAPLAWKVRRRG
jgi:hypothetical protein